MNIAILEFNCGCTYCILLVYSGYAILLIQQINFVTKKESFWFWIVILVSILSEMIKCAVLDWYKAFANWVYRFHFIVEWVICVSDIIFVSMFVFLSTFFSFFNGSVTVVVFWLCTTGFHVQLFDKTQFIYCFGKTSLDVPTYVINHKTSWFIVLFFGRWCLEL